MDVLANCQSIYQIYYFSANISIVHVHAHLYNYMHLFMHVCVFSHAVIALCCDAIILTVSFLFFYSN